MATAMPWLVLSPVMLGELQLYHNFYATTFTVLHILYLTLFHY